MTNGWIFLDRKIVSSWVAEDNMHFSAWVRILLSVQWEDETSLVFVRGSNFECKRGQSVKSLDTWVKLLGKGWTKQKVRTFFKQLETAGMINMENLSKTTRLTVCNYDTYQNKQTQTNTELLPKQHEVIPKVTTDKERRIKKEEKKDLSSLPAEAVSLARLLAENVKALNPNAKNVTVNIEETLLKWATDIEKLNRLDKKSYSDQEKVLKWVVNDSFWRKTILSGEKFRKQYDQLVIKSATVDIQDESIFTVKNSNDQWINCNREELWKYEQRTGLKGKIQRSPR